MKLFSKLIPALVVGSLAFSSFAAESINPTTVHVKNDDTAAVEVFFEPGEGNVTPSKTDRMYKVNAGSTLDVNVDELGFTTDTFTVRGKAPTVPSINNVCGNMFKGKSYNVVFTSGGAGGVKCSYTEATNTSTNN